MTQKDLNELAIKHTNSLLNCYCDSTKQEENIGLTLFEEGFRKALELIMISHAYGEASHVSFSLSVDDVIEML